MVTINYVKSKLNSTSNMNVKEAFKHEIKLNQYKCDFNTLLNFKNIIIPFFQQYFEGDYQETIEYIFTKDMLELSNEKNIQTDKLKNIEFFSSYIHFIKSKRFSCNGCSNYDECNCMFSNNDTLKSNLIILTYLLTKHNIVDNNIPLEIKTIIDDILSTTNISELLKVLNTSYIGELINCTKWNVNIAKVLMTINLIEYKDFYSILKYNNSITSAIINCRNSNDNNSIESNNVISTNNKQTSVIDFSTNRGNSLETVNNHNALHELHQMIGLKKVKEQIENLHDLLCFRKLTEKQLNLPEINLNCVFQGNPGTGKTKTAKLYADILYDAGFIKTNKLVCVSAGDLIAEFVGATAIKTTNVIKASLGGVLFVDEAYQLTPKGEKDFGRECIATFVREMTEHKNNLVIIFAGYKKEMQEFIDVNPGMKSRITNFINFEDYTPDELFEIFKLNLDNANLNLCDNLEITIKKIFKEKSKDAYFGNARFVENLFRDMILEHSKNIMTKIRNNEINTNDESIKVLNIKDIPDVYLYNNSYEYSNSSSVI